MPGPRILFIVNPAAGSGRGLARWRKFERRARSTGLTFDFVFTAPAGDTAKLAREAAGRFDVLAAVGGDGTVMEVAEGILSSGVNTAALGTVPCGTGNDFAANIGIGREGLRPLLAGRTNAVDVLRIHCVARGGQVNRHALVAAGTGIMAECLERTTPGLKRVCGRRLAYIVGALRALWHWRARPMRVTVDHQLFRQDFLLVSASNAEQAGGGLHLAPGAKMDDGLLDLNLVEPLPRWEALRQLVAMKHGGHVKHPRVRYFQGGRLEVDSEPACPIAADGGDYRHHARADRGYAQSAKGHCAGALIFLAGERPAG